MIRLISASLRGTAATVALLALLGTGCSSFPRKWKAAASTPATHALAGRWIGTWTSDVNGHKGSLRCLVTATNAHHYRAFFQARYQKILSFSYAVPLAVEQREGVAIFQGEADLGWAGGVYHYDGEADATNFVSRYRSERDHGQFRMRRP